MNPTAAADLLAIAAAVGNRQEVRRLLDWGTDADGLNSYGRTPIQVESAPTHPRTRLLFYPAPHPTPPPPPPLQEARK